MAPRCFPHVVNIAVKAGLKKLTKLDPSDEDIDSAPSRTQVLHNNEEYLAVLKEDVVSSARSLVTACRASGQRREDLQNTISEGNDDGGWGDPPRPLRNVVLLRDVDTRWSSIFRMIDRVLELYEVFFSSAFTFLNTLVNSCVTGYRGVSEETKASRNLPPCPQ